MGLEEAMGAQAENDLVAWTAVQSEPNHLEAMESRVLQLVRDGAAARRAVEIAEQMVTYAERREAQVEEALILALEALKARAYASRLEVEGAAS